MHACVGDGTVPGSSDSVAGSHHDAAFIVIPKCVNRKQLKIPRVCYTFASQLRDAKALVMRIHAIGWAPTFLTDAVCCFFPTSHNE